MAEGFKFLYNGLHAICFIYFVCKRDQRNYLTINDRCSMQKIIVCIHMDLPTSYILACCCLFCRQIFLLHAINNWAKFMQATKPKRYTVNEKWDFVFIPPTILPTCLFLHDKRCKVAKYFQTHTRNTKIHTWYNIGWTAFWRSI